VLAGCAEESREGDAPGPKSPPGQIVTVPGSGESPAAGSPGAAAEPQREPTKAAYVERADDICAEARPRIDSSQQAAAAFAKQGDFEAAAESFEEGIEASEREVAALRELTPPPGSEALLDRMYAGIEKANRFFRGSLDDLRFGDVPAFNAIGARARLAARGSRRIATSFGFEVCGR
jgi:hypothetical protein